MLAASILIYARRFDPRRLLDDSPSLLPADYRQRELVPTSSGYDLETDRKRRVKQIPYNAPDFGSLRPKLRIGNFNGNQDPMDVRGIWNRIRGSQSWCR